MKMCFFFFFAFCCFFSCSTDDPSNDVDANLIQVQLQEGTNMAATLSPDQSTLAIDLQGTIWLVPAEGGTATALTDPRADSHEPSWSPDGQFLAFQSYAGGNFHIWIIDKEGKQLEQITFGAYDDREPHWSPDGQRLGFFIG